MHRVINTPLSFYWGVCIKFKNYHCFSPNNVLSLDLHVKSKRDPPSNGERCRCVVLKKDMHGLSCETKLEFQRGWGGRGGGG